MSGTQEGDITLNDLREWKYQYPNRSLSKIGQNGGDSNQIVENERIGSNTIKWNAHAQKGRTVGITGMAWVNDTIFVTSCDHDA